MAVFKSSKLRDSWDQVWSVTGCVSSGKRPGLSGLSVLLSALVFEMEARINEQAVLYLLPHLKTSVL